MQKSLFLPECSGDKKNLSIRLNKRAAFAVAVFEQKMLSGQSKSRRTSDSFVFPPECEYYHIYTNMSSGICAGFMEQRPLQSCLSAGQLPQRGSLWEEPLSQLSLTAPNHERSEVFQRDTSAKKQPILFAKGAPERGAGLPKARLRGLEPRSPSEQLRMGKCQR